MEHLVGNRVFVSLKNEDETLKGLLIHVEEHYVYLQMDESTYIYVVPKSNVKYYVTDNLPSQSRVIPSNNQEYSAPTPQPERNAERQDAPSFISVFVNGDHIANIDNPGLDLSVFSNEIMTTVLGDRRVQAILAGRRQKEFRYDVGKAYITTVPEDEEPVGVLPQSNQNVPNTFGMGGSNVTGQFMSGQQMVDMLNNSNRGKKDE